MSFCEVTNGLTLFSHINAGSSREGTDTPAGTSYDTCIAAHQAEQVQCHFATEGIPNASYCVCQLEMCKESHIVLSM